MLEIKHIKVARDDKVSYFVVNKEGNIVLSTEKKSIINHWCDLLEIDLYKEARVTSVDNVHITTYSSDITVKQKDFNDKKEIPVGVKPCITILPMKDCNEYMEVIAYIYVNGLTRTIYIPLEESDAFVELYTGTLTQEEVLPFLNYNFKTREEVELTC
ncbi:hypothetical protein P9X10_01275 [Bacillus cereus]|nr:hypothetical protein [Bacillus cereus]